MHGPWRGPRRVCGAHARGERAERAIRAGMRIRTDHEVAGHHGAGLGQKGMLDARAALLPVMGDLLLMGEVTHLFGLLGALDVLVGRVVVRHQAHAVAVEHLGGAQLVEHVDRDGRGDIVREHEVQIALYELAGANLVQPGMSCEDLLCYGHRSWHGFLPSC